MASIGDVFLRILLDDTDFEKRVIETGKKAGDKAGLSMGQQLAAGISKSSNEIGKSLAGIGQNLTKTGRGLTTNLTLPILGAGAAVTHFALDFDTSMRRIVGLAKVPKDEIAGVRESILKMGADIGRSPQELAEAFYFVASAGFKADEAMKVLETSAKASAAGMGQVQDVAKVLGGVINAYGHENITAAHAGDVLTAAIQDGAAEASDFAGAIGMVVPNAAALGISFDQVAAAMSAMTQVGIDAQTAAVNLGQILSALQKPSSQAEEALKSLGLSSAGLRQELREKGLLETLRTLEERFRGNETASALVFGNIRALRGVSALLGMDTKQLNAIFADTAGALDTLQGAYDDTAGPQRELDKAMASLQATAIELGADVLPMVVDVVKQIAAGARELAKWWKSLDADTRKGIVQWLAWVAIAGPVLLLFGKLAAGAGALFKVVGFLAGAKGIPALASAAGRARLLMLGFLAGAIALATFGLIEAGEAASDFIDELLHGKQANKVLKDLTALVGNRKFARELREWGVSVEDFGKVLERTEGDADAAFKAIVDAGGDVGRALDDLGTDAKVLGIRFGRDIPAGMEAAAEGVRLAAGRIPEEVSVELEDGQFVVGDAADEMVDPIAEAVEKAKQDVADAANDLIHTLASTLSSNPQELRDAAKAMWEDILHPFPDIKHRLELEGILASKWLIDGLTSSDSGDRARTAEYLKGILAEYELLAPGALAAGELINPALQDGINNTLDALLLYIQNTPGMKITSAFDFADTLEDMGYKGLAGYVRGMETARIMKVNPVADKMMRDLHRTLDADLYDDGYNSGLSYADGLKAAKDAIAYQATFIRRKVEAIMNFSGSPPYAHSREIGEKVGDSWWQELFAALTGGLPRLGSIIAEVARAMTPQLAMGVGLAGASVPSLATVAASAAGTVAGNSVVNNGGETALTINGGIHLHDVGSNVSREAAGRFGQEILDAVATGLQEQGARFGNRPRVNMG